MIITQFDLRSWQKSINKKLNIIKDIRYVYQNKVDANREDLLSVLIIILIMIEVFFAEQPQHGKNTASEYYTLV